MTLVTTICMKYRNKGFTLVELLIVMTILVTMISVAAPYAKNSNKKSILLNEALNMKELIYYAMDKSRSTNTAIRFVHSKSDRSYWLETSNLLDHYEFKELDNSLGSAHRYNNAIQSISTETIMISDTLEATNGFEYIIFDPRQELPSGITIQLETLHYWTKLKINKRNFEVSNGNF